MKRSRRTIILSFLFSFVFCVVLFGGLSFIPSEFQWPDIALIAFSLAVAFIFSLLDGMIDLRDGVEQQKLANSEMLGELSNLSEIREELSNLSELRKDISDLKRKLIPEPLIG